MGHGTNHGGLSASLEARLLSFSIFKAHIPCMSYSRSHWPKIP